MTAWSGRKDGGSRSYSPAQRERVLRALGECVGHEARTTFEKLKNVTGLENRTVREVIRDADGVEFVVAVEDTEVWIARSVDETEHHTRLLRASARSRNERADRRERYAQQLPRIQQVMFP